MGCCHAVVQVGAGPRRSVREEGRRAMARLAVGHDLRLVLDRRGILDVGDRVPDDDRVDLDVAAPGRRLDGERELALHSIRLLTDVVLEDRPRDRHLIKIVRGRRVLGVVFEEEVGQVLSILASLELHVAVPVRPLLVLLDHLRVLLTDHVHFLRDVGMDNRAVRDSCLLVHARRRVNAVVHGSRRLEGELSIHLDDPPRSRRFNRARLSDGRIDSLRQRKRIWSIPAPSVVSAPCVRDCDGRVRRVKGATRRDCSPSDHSTSRHVCSYGPGPTTSRKDQVTTGPSRPAAATAERDGEGPSGESGRQRDSPANVLVDVRVRVIVERELGPRCHGGDRARNIPGVQRGQPLVDGGLTLLRDPDPEASLALRKPVVVRSGDGLGSDGRRSVAHAPEPEHLVEVVLLDRPRERHHSDVRGVVEALDLSDVIDAIPRGLIRDDVPRSVDVDRARFAVVRRNVTSLARTLSELDFDLEAGVGIIRRCRRTVHATKVGHLILALSEVGACRASHEGTSRVVQSVGVELSASDSDIVGGDSRDEHNLLLWRGQVVGDVQVDARDDAVSAVESEDVVPFQDVGRQISLLKRSDTLGRIDVVVIPVAGKLEHPGLHNLRGRSPRPPRLTIPHRVDLQQLSRIVGHSLGESNRVGNAHIHVRQAAASQVVENLVVAVDQVGRRRVDVRRQRLVQGGQLVCGVVLDLPRLDNAVRGGKHDCHASIQVLGVCGTRPQVHSNVADCGTKTDGFRGVVTEVRGERHARQ
mmetsp:Transcript_41726/g.64272  ORF Transcript_41726/g.64272 Transcript_41726/m.64272 type:complete len:755 (-) Transcript_41726:666-2930(-)